MEWVSFVEGRVIVWTPLPGMDASLGERAMRKGAAAYAIALVAGKPEEVAQQEAEKVVYQVQFGVQY